MKRRGSQSKGLAFIMNEFNKPYEYEEESRGIVFFFVLMIITFDLLIPIFYITEVPQALSHNLAARVSYIILSAVYLLAVPVTAFQCYKLKRTMVLTAKIYLIIRTVFYVTCIIIQYQYHLKYGNMIGKFKRYSTIAQFRQLELYLPLVYVMITCGGWFLYFIFSKKCKAIKEGKTALQK